MITFIKHIHFSCIKNMSMHNSKSIIEWFFLNENLWLRFPSGDSKSLIVYKWKIWFLFFFFFIARFCLWCPTASPSPYTETFRVSRFIKPSEVSTWSPFVSLSLCYEQTRSTCHRLFRVVHIYICLCIFLMLML